MLSMDLIPRKETFELIRMLDFDRMADLPKQQTRLILPCLVRMGACTSLDVSDNWRLNRKKLKKLIVSFPEVNDILLLLSFKYADFEGEVKKEMQFRFKMGTQDGDSLLLSGIRLDRGLLKPFELSDLKTRMKIVLSELILLMNQVRNIAYSNNNSGGAGGSNQNSGPFPSDLFDSNIYLDELIDFMYFAISEMPNIFQLYDVVEALLLVKNGLPAICCLITNFPESFHETCMALITNGGNDDSDSFYAINRVRVLRTLCQINPNEALLIRSEAVELCRMPNLVVMLTLDHARQNDISSSSSSSGENIDVDRLQHSKTDIIAFITGILLSNDDRIRTWFSQYIKSSQKRSASAAAMAAANSADSSANSFVELRQVLLNRFREVTDLVASLDATDRKSSGESELILTEACIMLRLYCALRGVASMKFTDEETSAICRMIICRPPHSYISVRFVSFGLCMILAFPSLVTVSENEGKIVDWIRWLVQEESYLGKVTGMKSSFGEMLLLIAIHFHSNQTSAIGELISSTIGIKLPIRINDLNRIKNIFTQDIFTDQTVAAHAVKVPVTRHLNDSVSGFLPVHCIYQLLRSRAFTKNKVPIKDWILKQIRNCVAPIHPIVPQLIETYVNSILIPNTQSFHLTNEPISEEDVASIFEKRVYSFDDSCDRNENGSAANNNGDDDDDEDDDDEDDEDDDDDDEDGGDDADEDSVDVIDQASDQTAMECDNANHDDNEIACTLTSQLLMLYYVLLYEDVRLMNMKAITAADRKVVKYSDELIAQLPIFYLVQKTRKCQAEYGALLPPLLKLIAVHYPHLCLVKDWLPDSMMFAALAVGRRASVARSLRAKSCGTTNAARHANRKRRQANRHLSAARERETFLKAFKSSKSGDVNFNSINDAFERLLHLPDERLWPLAPEFVSKLTLLLRESSPRIVAMNAKAIWHRLNHIFPTKLWEMTVNALDRDRADRIAGRHFSVASTWSEIVQNPLIVLNCDRRVFRTPELMEITLHILSGFLSASRTISTRHLLEKPSRNVDEAKNREELKVTMLSVTESIAIQSLLECCLLTGDDFEDDDDDDGDGDDDDSEDEDAEDDAEDDEDEDDRDESDSDDAQDDDNDNDTNDSANKRRRRRRRARKRQNGLSNFREVQGLIFTHIHQCFIADVNLAKLVHFQGYRHELLPLVVTGIPSMHICIDFLPELLNQLELEKQAFAMNLCSHLCEYYPIVRFMNIAKLCLTIAGMHLSVLPSARRATFYLSIIPSLERMCQVFPPLIEDFVALLVQLAQKNRSRLSARSTLTAYSSLEAIAINSGSSTDHSQRNSRLNKLINMEWTQFERKICRHMDAEEALSISIHKAFAMLCKLGLLSKVYKEQVISL